MTPWYWRSSTCDFPKLKSLAVHANAEKILVRGRMHCSLLLLPCKPDGLGSLKSIPIKCRTAIVNGNMSLHGWAGVHSNIFFIRRNAELKSICRDSPELLEAVCSVGEQCLTLERFQTLAAHITQRLGMQAPTSVN